MEVYVLDSLFRREKVIDRFESLIWTERFSDVGDFSLQVRATTDMRSWLRKDVHLAMNESHRVMKIETVEVEQDEEGRSILRVTGPSLEAVLEDRAAVLRTETGFAPKWVIEATPVETAKRLFNDICILGSVDEKDILPMTFSGNIIVPASTIPEVIDAIISEIEPKSLFAAIKQLADVWVFGFSILRRYDMSQLYFDVYTGNDRSSSQTDFDPVIFSPQLDNLQNTKSLDTISGAKNVVMVYSEFGSYEYTPEDVNLDIDGFERRVLVVQAEGIEEDTPNPTIMMDQQAREALAEHRAFTAFDGEVSPRSQYKYGVDYFLGDIVELQNHDGTSQKMRVTEQIFSSDAEGDKSYPTLTVNAFVNAGSWASWTDPTTWEDLSDNPMTWAEQE